MEHEAMTPQDEQMELQDAMAIYDKYRERYGGMFAAFAAYDRGEYELPQKSEKQD